MLFFTTDALNTAKRTASSYQPGSAGKSRRQHLLVRRRKVKATLHRLATVETLVVSVITSTENHCASRSKGD